MSNHERPVRPETKQTEKKAVKMVEDFFNELYWATNPASEEDYGVDLFVTVFEPEPPHASTPVDFCVQVKGTRRLAVDDDHLLWSIEKKHIRYWLERPLPVLFLLCDVVQERIYWLWVKKYLSDELPHIKPNWKEYEKVTLQIPRTNCLTRESSTDLRRQAGRMVWPIAHESLRLPTALNKQERQKIFPYKLDNLPYPFIDEQRKSMDVLFIAGPTRYDLEKTEARFEKRKTGFRDVELGNEIVLGESAYNLALASDILSTLCFIAGEKRLNIESENGRLLLPYLEVDDSMLARHNIMCIPCGDVNPLLTIALKDFEMRYLVRCPVHHEPYEASERIKSESTGALYEKEREHEWAGYIVLLPSPWNPRKALLICGGNKGVGTQAALLRLLMALRGKRSLRNSSGLPAKVVTPHGSKGTLYNTLTMMVHDVRDLE